MNPKPTKTYQSVVNVFGLVSLFVFFGVNVGWGQTTLLVGDVAVVAINSTNPDQFTFVILKDIASGTIINFTDNGFTAGTTGRTGEGFLTFTAASNYAAGTTFFWQNGATLSSEWSSNNPTNFAFNASGDQLFIFQGSTGNWASQSGITLLYGINYGTPLSATSSAANTVQPTALTSSYFLNLPSNSANNGYFSNTGSSATSVSVSGSASTLMASFVNSSLWFTQSNSSGATIFPTFSITVGTLGNYWDGNGSTAGCGSSGTWSSSSLTFALDNICTNLTSGLGQGSGTIVFGGTSGTVNVSGTVSANNGIQFSTSGYTLSGGTGINMAGSTAFNNTITTDPSVSSTISTSLSISNGMTKSGTGTLILNAANTNSGSTNISQGTLKATNNTALGTSVVALSNASLYVGTGINLSNNITINSNSSFTVNYNFTNASSNTAAATSQTGSGYTVGSISKGNNNGTSTFPDGVSASSGYTGVSGGNNASAAARTGALSIAANGSAYFEFTLTPTSGTVSLSSLTFGSRSTSTGPQAYAIRSSKDNYASDIVTGAIPNNGSWNLYSPSFTAVTSNSATAITFRIYGYNGTGSPSAGTDNWRIDDLNLAGSVTSASSGSNIIGSDITSGTSTYSGSITLNDNVTLTSALGGTVLVSGKITNGTGSPTLTKLDVGTLQLNNSSNDYKGITLIKAGFISSSGEGVYGANPSSFVANQITLDGGGIQNVSGSNINFNSNRGITLGSNGGTFDVTSSQQITLTNVVTGSGSLTKSNSGTLVLPTALTYTGATNINGGTVQLTTGNDRLPTSTAVTLANVSGAILDLNSRNQTIGSLAGGGTTGGNVTLGSGTLTVGDGSSTSYSGVVSGSGAFVKQGSGTLSLANSNSYTGSTTINAGTLQLTTGNDRLPTGTAVTLANVAGAILDLNSRNQTIGSLAGGGVTGGNVTLGSGTLTVGDGSSTTYSGVISGSGSLIKHGSGTLTLGNSNTYSGSTTITLGTITLGILNALPATSLILNGGTLNTGFTSGFNLTLGTLNIADNSTIALGTGVHSLTFSNSSVISWTGGKTLNITGWTGTPGLSGTSGKIFFGNSNGTLTAGQLSQISFSGYYGTPILLNTGELVPPDLYYRSKTTGSFENITSWEVSTDNITFAPATQVPDFNSKSIVILPSHNITLNSSRTLDQFTITTGGTLTLGNTILTINDGTGIDFNVIGTFIDNSSDPNLISFNSGATWTLSNTGTYIKTSSSDPSNLQANYDGGISNISSTPNWIIRYLGTVDVPFISGLYYYPNLSIESTTTSWTPTSSSSQFTGTGTNYTTIKGNLDIGGSGTGTVNIINSNTASQPLLIQKDLVIRAGSSLLNSGGGTGFEILGNLTVLGTLTANSGGAGIIKFSGSTVQNISGSGTLNAQDLNITNSLGIWLNRNLTAEGTTTITAGGINLNGNALTLNGSTFADNSTIVGSGSVFSNAYFRTTNANGFSGTNATIPTAPVTLGSNSVVEFAGAGAATINGSNISPTPHLFSNVIASGGGLKTLPSTFSINSNGYFNITSDCEVDGGANAYSFSPNVTVSIAGMFSTSNPNGLTGSSGQSFSATNAPTIVLPSTSTINYYADVPQSVTGGSVLYQNIKFLGLGKKNFPSILNIQGNITNGMTATSAGFGFGTSIVSLSGANLQIISNTGINSFYNLHINKTLQAVSIAGTSNVNEIIGICNIQNGPATTMYTNDKLALISYSTGAISAVVSGSLLDFSSSGPTNGSVDGKVIVQRSFGTTADNRAYFLSMPVTGNLDQMQSASTNFFFYNETKISSIDPNGTRSQLWENISSPASTANTIGRAYSMRFRTNNINGVNRTVWPAGNLYNGTINLPVTNTGQFNTATLNGWNLLGNPYPSPVNLNALTLSNIDGNSFYIWQGDKYGVWNATLGTGINGVTNTIGVMQGFFVRATGNGSVGFTNAARTSGQNDNLNFYRVGGSSLPLITLNLTKGSERDQTKLVMHASATSPYLWNDKADAYKLAGNANKIGFYTLKENRPTSIYTFDTVSSSITVPLGVTLPVDTTVTFSLESMENMDPQTEVTLEDRTTQNYQPLALGAYSVSLPRGTYQNRFYLSIRKTAITQTNGTEYKGKISLFANEKSLKMVNTGLPLEGTNVLKIYDVSGKLIWNKVVQVPSGILEITIDEWPTGIYLFELNGTQVQERGRVNRQLD